MIYKCQVVSQEQYYMGIEIRTLYLLPFFQCSYFNILLVLHIKSFIYACEFLFFDDICSRVYRKKSIYKFLLLGFLSVLSQKNY